MPNPEKDGNNRVVGTLAFIFTIRPVESLHNPQCRRGSHLGALILDRRSKDWNEVIRPSSVIYMKNMDLFCCSSMRNTFRRSRLSRVKTGIAQWLGWKKSVKSARSLHGKRQTLHRLKSVPYICELRECL